MRLAQGKSGKEMEPGLRQWNPPIVLGVDYPFFHSSLISETSRFCLSFRMVSRKKDPWKEWTWKVPLEILVDFDPTHMHRCEGAIWSQRSATKISHRASILQVKTISPRPHLLLEGSHTFSTAHRLPVLAVFST